MGARARLRDLCDRAGLGAARAHSGRTRRRGRGRDRPGDAARRGVLVEGKLRQLGTPEELVARPEDQFVASFTGANLLHGAVELHDDGVTRVRLVSGEVVYSTDRADGEVGVVVYPWDVSIGRVHADDSAMNLVQGEVASVAHVGNRVRVRVGPLTAEVTEASAERLDLAVGSRVYASFKATGTRLVPLGGSERISPHPPAAVELSGR